MSFSLSVNGKSYDVDIEPETPLLWVIRDSIGLIGTKFGCGISECGACMVHINGQPTKSCNISAASATGKEITTIEGLSTDRSHPIQQAWIKHSVPQCGYCQSGQIMSAAALLERNSDPSDGEINVAMADNICRCSTYPAIRAAIHTAAEITRG